MIKQIMADDFFSDAVQQFSKNRASALDGIWDAVWFKEIYGQIVQITGSLLAKLRPDLLGQAEQGG